MSPSREGGPWPEGIQAARARARPLWPAGCPSPGQRTGFTLPCCNPWRSGRLGNHPCPSCLSSSVGAVAPRHRRRKGRPRAGKTGHRSGRGEERRRRCKYTSREKIQEGEDRAERCKDPSGGWRTARREEGGHRAGSHERQPRAESEVGVAGEEPDTGQADGRRE